MASPKGRQSGRNQEEVGSPSDPGMLLKLEREGERKRKGRKIQKSQAPDKTLPATALATMATRPTWRPSSRPPVKERTCADCEF
jgi:hypothetical protein